MSAQPLDIAKKIWEHYSPKRITTVEENNELVLKLANRLTYLFQPGDFYYYIFNVSNTEFEYISPSVEKILGYRPEELNVNFFFNQFHPEDQVAYVNYENEVGKFLQRLSRDQIFKYKVRMDFRIKKSDGSYVRILHQVMVFDINEDGNILRSLGVHADIGYLKTEGKPSLSFIGIDGEPSYINVKVADELIPVKETLTKREKEILEHIMKGMLNKEIAMHLNISKETVDKHRKNMLEKADCKNSSELIVKAIRNGWV